MERGSVLVVARIGKHAPVKKPHLYTPRRNPFDLMNLMDSIKTRIYFL